MARERERRGERERRPVRHVQVFIRVETADSVS